jgi:hypothetical protein
MLITLINVNTTREKKGTLIGIARYVGLEINAEKTQYMIMSRHPNSEQNQNIRIANEWFENVAKFKYLGTTLTNQNDIHDEIKSRECLLSFSPKYCLPASHKKLKIKYIKL